MYNALLVALVIVSIMIILFVVMQPSKSNAASTLTGGGDDGTVKQKARGFEAFLIRATTVLGILFFVLTIALAYLSAK
ncbi:preprotein translocase subunit SecG [Facklamia sp. DSM 111018]|uniref:Protein-export membrane protein SecG n=1 Tax=Facklamia lactis TaxID=2749967 RepID=A0ABS0LR88_9LACT|nr:preprotein translocase subunit SecG [Facklamia lactis]MBG9980962.1 preprotein translocase subunit SecG [Facklamia lactis]MBG9986675.1 preprotein translocase subunit SecG [Facklamia lactis]